MPAGRKGATGFANHAATPIAESIQMGPPASPGSYAPNEPGTDHGASSSTAVPSTVPVDDVIDVQAVARLLRVGRNTVYTLVSRNEIPHRRLGKQIRFHQGAIMRWLGSWSSQDAKEGQ